jgi:hypothetical protein
MARYKLFLGNMNFIRYLPLVVIAINTPIEVMTIITTADVGLKLILRHLRLL